jgi:hypothetical protein
MYSHDSNPRPQEGATSSARGYKAAVKLRSSRDQSEPWRIKALTNLGRQHDSYYQWHFNYLTLVHVRRKSAKKKAKISEYKRLSSYLPYHIHAFGLMEIQPLPARTSYSLCYIPPRVLGQISWLKLLIQEGLWGLFQSSDRSSPRQMALLVTQVAGDRNSI